MTKIKKSKKILTKEDKIKDLEREILYLKAQYKGDFKLNIIIAGEGKEIHFLIKSFTSKAVSYTHLDVYKRQVKESCILFTLPVVNDVVTSVNNIEARSPNLISLPSMLMPFIPY